LAQKAPDLLVSAYALKNGIIEALDSPRHRHRWVVGVQWHPERRGEVARHFQRLFARLVAVASETREQA
ncbi:MAG: gamma-glutamyl-gamma-aminobutyrate hydrolase family protein, partial [Chloroflexi bacterium]|nr:gamma-glutamyl-gamma-aminobutyrate hydrolase family protein [Chloroflexota bacterium]